MRIDGVPLLAAPRLDPVGLGLTTQALDWFTTRVGRELIEAAQETQESPRKPWSGQAQRVLACFTPDDLEELEKFGIKLWPSRAWLMVPLSEADRASASSSKRAGKKIPINFPRASLKASTRRKRKQMRAAAEKAKVKAIKWCAEQGWVSDSESVDWADSASALAVGVGGTPMQGQRGRCRTTRLSESRGAEKQHIL